MSNKTIFTRNVPGTTDTLAKKCIAIAGCGGIGSNAAVALTRAGIGKLVLIDFDKVEESNLNRQFYFQDDVGKIKVEALKNHLLKINPDLKIETHNLKLTKDNANIVDSADILIEAFDKAEEKKWLIDFYCKNYPNKKIICASGVSGLGNFHSIKQVESGNIIICGDQESDMSIGLCSARISIVANMQANAAIEVLVNDSSK